MDLCTWPGLPARLRLPTLNPSLDSVVDIYRDLFKQTLPGIIKAQALE